VHHILNRHNAQLIIASEVGKGSTFSCRFPVTSGLHRHPSEPAASAMAAAR
jgi:two-component system phosphate regulon sensor histidine kinase PhoR